jgi:hypothetical protein
MTLRQRIEMQSGTVYAFVRQFGFSVPILYGVLTRKRAASTKTLDQLSQALGLDARSFFDDDGVLVQK